MSQLQKRWWLLAVILAGALLFVGSAAAYNFTSNSTNNIYTFTYNENFTINATTTAAQGGQFLIIAGGGGGGSGSNTGGTGAGAGGFMLNTSANFTAGTYTITVGNGGQPGTYSVNNATAGGTSSFAGFSMTGGAPGSYGLSPSTAGQNGGSGSGSAYNGAAGTGTSGQGNNGGGSVNTGSLGTGGGGGANTTGGAGTTAVGGKGGDGNWSGINTTQVCYAGGGAGTYDTTGGGTAGVATCGGGNGATNAIGGGNGTPGTGAGGGAGANLNAANKIAGAGASGVVILSLPKGPNSFSITAINNYTGAAINTFNANVTINGTLSNYGTTNGTINFNFTQGSILVNVSANTSAGLFFTNQTFNWNTSTNYVASLVPWANITARDLYDGSAISAFGATYNGTLYSTTNGYVQVPALGLYNATTNTSSYFNGSLTNVLANATQNATMFQAQVVFNAFEVVTNTNITNFTASNNSILNSNSTNTVSPVLFLKAGNYNITFNLTGWFNKTFPITVTALENATQNLTGVFRYLLNISFQSATNGTFDPQFTAYVTSTNYSYTATATTTNSTVQIPWTNETNFNISVGNGSFLAAASQRYNTSNDTFTPITDNISVQSLTTNTFNLFFFNETTDLALNTNVTVSFISNNFAVNVTTGNTSATINVSLLTPTSYQIQYFADPLVIRNYYVTLTNQTFNTLRLYTIDLVTRALYSAVALDQYGAPCSNQTVSLLRYFVNANAYRTVEMERTDTNGAAVFSLQPNIIDYKFQFAGSCGSFTTSPQRVTAATNSFTINNAQSPLASVAGYTTVTRSLSFVNATRTFVYTWADTRGLVTNACLVTTQSRGYQTLTTNTTCLAASSGSIIYTVNDTNNTRYVSTGTLTLTDGTQFSDTAAASYANAPTTFGLNGVFISLLVLLAFVSLGGTSPDEIILKAIGAVAIDLFFGFLAGDWTYFVGVAAVGFYLIYKLWRT